MVGFEYGDSVTNIAASDDNPAKHGTFLRRGFNSSRVNRGPWVEYVWGAGEVFRTTPDNLRLRERIEPHD